MRSANHLRGNLCGLFYQGWFFPSSSEHAFHVLLLLKCYLQDNKKNSNNPFITVPPTQLKSEKRLKDFGQSSTTVWSTLFQVDSHGLLLLCCPSDVGPASTLLRCLLDWISRRSLWSVIFSSSWTSHLYSPLFLRCPTQVITSFGKMAETGDQKHSSPLYIFGQDKILYAQGVVVRHQREYFKAEGVANCAEPGNQSHLRFYVVFSNPVGGFGTLPWTSRSFSCSPIDSLSFDLMNGSKSCPCLVWLLWIVLRSSE